ncbi:MAG: lipopolysaccharide assembly protein LapB [Gammaproteobacteria bacterium]|nr:lipopolysaccharide assembly protein LapB [Gammaproteobacteria bacterium]MDA8011029.1 lipopolysaccharide assembly protein LapB [Gammaproteobacteria bacterium]
MDPLWLLLLLPTAAAGGWVMAKRERRAERRKHLPEAYFKGLSFLLNEQPDEALRVFLEVVEVDSETVEIHLALGNLFRRRGEIERATRIHQNLVARSDLDPGLREQALFELAQDYFKAGLFDRAESLFRELRRAPDYRAQACRFLMQIYDQEKEWESAIRAAEELARAAGADMSQPLAHYYCELAEQAIADGRNARAGRHIESAFRHDPHCIRAVIQSGRLASMSGNHINAISIWRGLERWAPQALGEVVDHVANSYTALGDAKSYKKFLEDALARNPDARFIAALVELVSREEKDEAGRKLLVDLVRRHPSIEGLHELLKSRAASGGGGRENRDFALLADLLSQVVGQGRGYHCRTCGFSSNSLHWQCPGCKNWGTVQKRAAAEPLRRAVAMQPPA